ncbi:DeoR/GlpR family DNA-binding transcription regulator [Acidilutibacter cellobiosedens]|jgi:DeoR/GlpR family transcriptional regulator of sugar metabolism|nr:DeoR/GlpR family DNA-binding transcription regulator [Acidilutibacter cellobiosedens]
MDRLTKILDLVNKYKKIEVSKLSDALGVSQVTIRKDLDVLVKKGLISREHGYATLNESDDINNRLSINYDIKKKIARSALDIISNGETVMIESGSTCAMFAEELAKNKKNITIITNSAFIASYIRKYPDCRTILLGGEYQKGSQVNVGPITKKCALEFFVDKLFIGIDGISMNADFTSSDLMRAETVKAMTTSANHVIVLTDSSKFMQRGLVNLLSFDEVDYLFTDTDIPDDIKYTLENHKIKLNTI